MLIGSVCSLLGAGCVSEPTRVGARYSPPNRAAVPLVASFAAEGARASEYQSPRPVATRLAFIATEPPPTPVSQPRERTPRRPAREAVWIEGHWAYTNHLDEPYEWLPGHWEIPPAGSRSWVSDAWQPTEDGYLYVRGHWQ